MPLHLVEVIIVLGSKGVVFIKGLWEFLDDCTENFPDYWTEVGDKCQSTREEQEIVDYEGEGSQHLGVVF